MANAIDIMIPYWGDPGRLVAAVDSVRAQTSPDWRLTVVDDCYPDPTAGLAIQSIDDPRITYLRNETNLGITGNFRTCVRLARAEYTVVMGCDDLLGSRYVATVGEAVSHYPGADIVQVGVEVIDEVGRPSSGLVDTVKRRMLAPRGERPVVLAGEDAAASLLRGDWLYWPSLAFKTASVQRHDFRDGFPVIQDLALLIDMVVDGASLLYYPRTVFSYRRHRESASQAAARAGDRFAGEAEYYRVAARLMDRAGWTRAARVARRRVISRLHAVALMPRALARADRGVLRLLAHHALERDPRT
ncbi:MAG: glycosyltransferase [Bifidobacteriaceae bacterium]|jgi:glycosyltransferase involved in cell wall biosynthesis|nr:glycosyltransferase [Bifidobacteriaceae bacterium]